MGNDATAVGTQTLLEKAGDQTVTPATIIKSPDQPTSTAEALAAAGLPYDICGKTVNGQYPDKDFQILVAMASYDHTDGRLKLFGIDSLADGELNPLCSSVFGYSFSTREWETEEGEVISLQAVAQPPPNPDSAAEFLAQFGLPPDFAQRTIVVHPSRHFFIGHRVREFRVVSSFSV